MKKDKGTLTMNEFNDLKRMLWWSEKVDFVLTFYRKWPFITFRRTYLIDFPCFDDRPKKKGGGI